ncbi:MAG: hypothetical protein H0T62_11245 [Parachlamydiaceae bacterium]|nr:hypothetical protein [Parachlamydiaceae bacterium]
MSIEPVSNQNYIQRSPGWETTNNFTMGDLNSDANLRVAVLALPARDIGYAHLALTQVHHSSEKFTLFSSYK